MESKDISIDENTECLSLRERILLMQTKNNKTNENIQSTSVLKRIHSISDSDDSDTDNVCQDKFPLSPLKQTSFTENIPEVLILSDSDDEMQVNIPAPEVFHHNFEYQEDLFCFIDNNKKQFDDGKSDAKLTKNSKHKRSPSKNLKDADKEIAKQQRSELREKKKQEKELAKALKQSEKELQKSKKPEECLKAMKIFIDHNLILQNGSQDIFCALDEGNVQYVIEENPVDFSVAWCKTVVDVTVENNQVLKEEREEFENQLVILIPNDFFIKMVHASIQKSKGKDTEEVILLDYIVNVTSLFPEVKITCVVLGLEKYLKTVKESESFDLTFKKMAKQVPKAIIEETIVEIQIQTDVNFIFLNSTREFGDLLLRFTKAIAGAPQKKEKQLQKDLAFSWYADADTSCPVKLGKDRHSFIKLWQQQLQQFQNVGLETAEAIAARYPSPEDLIKVYKQCASDCEAEKLLQDIVVRRNYGPLGTQRRIGPELSYKIYLFFTSQDGNQILQR